MRRTFALRTKIDPIFDACYILNLDRRTDRWAHVQRQIKKAKLDRFIKGSVAGSSCFTRISGVDGDAVDVAQLLRDGVVTELGFQRYQLPNEEKLFGMDLTKGAIGCALGHRKIWKQIVEAKNTSALILEDDVEFHPTMSRMLPEVWGRVPSDWDLVYLGGLDLLAAGKPLRPFIAEGVRRAYRGHRELTVYVLHHRSAARCLELSQPMTWQIDTHICSNVTAEPAAQDEYISDPMSYVFQPSLAIQVTSLGTDVQKKPSDNPALEDAARRMREFVGGATSVR